MGISTESANMQPANHSDATSTEKGKAELKLVFGGYSHQGVKDENQDAFAVYTPSLSELSTKGATAALADGVSSATHAADAAQLAVTQFIQEYYCTPDTWSTEKSAAKVLKGLNQWLCSQSDALVSATSHGAANQQQWLTTFSTLILKSATGFIFHVGDSRVAQYRLGKLEQITRDHNRRQGGKHVVLTRALGADARLKVDTHKVDVKAGDIYVLTCDGVHDFVSNKVIEAELAKLPSKPTVKALEACSVTLTELAKENGSDDNLTCLLAYVESTPERELVEIERDLRSKVIPPVLSPGMKLDQYVVKKAIHASTRSHLYIVEHAQTHKTSVLKVPSENFSEDPIYLQGFMREAWVGERIKHPNVMQVEPDNNESRFLYHVCEYIEGQTLTDWMHDNPKPTVGQVRDIIAQVIKALRAFQRLDMAHRDLKPDNIMIDQYGQVKLIDYGTVSVASLDEDASTIQESVPQGTLNYVAPETLLLMKADNMSDLFSLGVICFEMLTGQLPYKPMKRAEVTQTSYLDWQYRNAKQYRTDVPFWLDMSLEKATHPDPDKRYQAFSEFEAALSKPDTTAYEAYKKQPLLQRDPVKFWQGLSLILFISLCISLAQH